MLTHYTKKIDGLVKILSHGFAWVANQRNLVRTLIPYHNFLEREPQQFGMISFTELAPEEARAHSDTFGPYGIVVSDDWAKRQNAQRALYIDDKGPVTESLRAIFDIGYRDLQDRIRFPDDAAWQMAYENKAVASVVADAALWANLLQLYEYMESSLFAHECEWRIVHPDPYYSLANRPTEQVIKDVSPPKHWADILNVVKIAPTEVNALICSSSEYSTLQSALPFEYRHIPIIHAEG